MKGLRDYWAVNEREIEQALVADSGQALQEALAYLKVPIAQSGAIITYDLLPQVAAEELLLTLLFKNLIGNALKYVRPGEAPRIHLSAHRTTNDSSFSVQDNGMASLQTISKQSSPHSNGFVEPRTIFFFSLVQSPAFRYVRSFENSVKKA